MQFRLLLRVLRLDLHDLPAQRGNIGSRVSPVLHRRLKFADLRILRLRELLE